MFHGGDEVFDQLFEGDKRVGKLDVVDVVMVAFSSFVVEADVTSVGLAEEQAVFEMMKWRKWAAGAQGRPEPIPMPSSPTGSSGTRGLGKPQGEGSKIRVSRGMGKLQAGLRRLAGAEFYSSLARLMRLMRPFDASEPGQLSLSLDSVLDS